MAHLKKLIALILVVVVSTAVVEFLLVSVFGRQAHHGYFGGTSCSSNMHQSSTATMMYASDFDDHLPEAPVWMDRLLPYTKHDTWFRCAVAALDDSKAYGYAFKKRLSEASLPKIAEPQKQALIFDSLNLSRNATEDVEPSTDFPRHIHPNIAYADGHAKQKTSDAAG